MAWIKITDDRYGASFRTGINGLLYDIPLNVPVNVEDALADHIKGLGVACEEAEAPEGASKSKEGSGGVLAPISAGSAGGVEQPAMKTRALGDTPSPGGQPGDLTGSPGGEEDEEAEAKPAPENIIEERALTADTRVKGERRSGRDASVAEIAGEGEAGTTPAGAAASSSSKSQPERSREAAKPEQRK